LRVRPGASVVVGDDDAAALDDVGYRGRAGVGRLLAASEGGSGVVSARSTRSSCVA
jgi:hypothetical protein